MQCFILPQSPFSFKNSFMDDLFWKDSLENIL